MEIRLDIPEKYADLFKDAKDLEACFRQNNKRFKEFARFAINKDRSIEDVGKDIINQVISSSDSIKHSVEMVNQSVSDLNKNIVDFSNAAEKLVNSGALENALSFVNAGLNAANLCATTAGFMMMSEHLNEISKELSEVSKDVKDVVKHQEKLDQKEVSRLVNNYANLLNNESVGREITLDERYELVNEMFLTIEVLIGCFKDDIGHREVYYEALSMLLPMYIVSICKWDRAHYFTYGKFHVNHDKYVKIIDEFTDLDFFRSIQDYAFLDKNMNSRQAFDNAFAYIAKVNEQKVGITDNALIIKHFKSEKDYRDFNALQDNKIVETIKEYSESTYNEEDTSKLVSAIEQCLAAA